MTNTTCTFFIALIYSTNTNYFDTYLRSYSAVNMFTSEEPGHQFSTPHTIAEHVTTPRPRTPTWRKTNRTTLTPCNTGATGQIGSLKVKCTKLLKHLQQYFCFLLKIHGSSQTIKENFLSSVIKVRPTLQYCFKSRVTRPAFCFTI